MVKPLSWYKNSDRYFYRQSCWCHMGEEGSVLKNHYDYSLSCCIQLSRCRGKIFHRMLNIGCQSGSGSFELRLTQKMKRNI